MKSPKQTLWFALLASVWTSIYAEELPPVAFAPFDAAEAAEIKKKWSESIGKERVFTNSIGMQMVLLPPGEFTMGRTEEDLDKLLAVIEDDPEMQKHRGGMLTWSMLMMPAHRVRLTKPFYMGACEVTVEQYRRFVDASGYKTEAEQGLNHGKPYKGTRRISTWRNPMAWRPNYKPDDHEPVLHLCWNDCVAFCKWLSDKEGQEYTLPTEAEWEYACRAGTATPWSFGDYADVDRVAHEYAWWSDGDQAKHDRPRPVGQGKPNAFGLYDMHGNLWEYVADWWHRLSFKESPLNDPTGPSVQSEKNDLRRIIRGGSFDWGRWGSDAAYRMRITQHSNQHPHMGFRVAQRIKDVKGVERLVDPQAKLRSRVRDPGAETREVRGALKAWAPNKPLPDTLTVDLDQKTNIEFVRIPAGSFLMGSVNGPRDERPIHRVVISKPFYMARTEVTQGQWEAVMGPDKRLAGLRTSDNDMHGPNKAMNDLSWNACQAFIQKLKARIPEHDVDLPTEAQWEYACRAGSQSEYHFGDDAGQLGEYAWHADNMIWPGQPAFKGRTAYPDAGAKKPNDWGLYDMHGGMWEWCKDRYDADYYLRAPLIDPTGPTKGYFRVLRGGSWFRYSKYARSSYRRFFHPECSSDGVTAWILDFGCRLVIKPDEKPDLIMQARNLVRHLESPVIRVGTKGEWDDQTLGCFTVLEDGGRFYFYSGGTRFGQPKKIGMATSKDGVRWTKFEKNPLFLGSMPYAVKVGDTFRLYHPGKDENGKQGLLMRTSKDGFDWNKPELVLPGNIMDPCVVHVAETRFHLYYCGGGRKQRDGKEVWEFKAYMATSEDGIRWKKEPKPALSLGPEGSWDAQSHAGPCVLNIEDSFHMWYLGSGPYQGKTAWRIGHAVSPDGLSWAKTGTQPVLDIGKEGDWDGGTFMSFDVIFRDDQFHFWYAAAPTGHGDETKMKIQIGYGTNE